MITTVSNLHMDSPEGQGAYRAAMLNVRASKPGPLGLGLLVGRAVWPTAWPLRGDVMAPLMPFAEAVAFEAFGAFKEPFAFSMTRRGSAPG
jgi:hypothetical protein